MSLFRINQAAAGILVMSFMALLPVYAQPVALPLGADVNGLLAVARRLSPALRAAALDTEAASAKADAAGVLPKPSISDSYQYYQDPGVFSGHSITLSQTFPLWGKRALRRQAALDDVDAARGQASDIQEKLFETIKVEFARYYLITREIAEYRQIGRLTEQIRAAASARYGQGTGDQVAVIKAAEDLTKTETEVVRLKSEQDAARANLNVLIGRSPDAVLADPIQLERVPIALPPFTVLLDRAMATNPVLLTDNAAIAAARARHKLAGKAWYPDLTVAAGPLIQTNNRPVGFAATVGFNIPVPWSGEAAGQREAAAQLDATHERYDAAQLKIEGALREALIRLRAAKSTVTLLRRNALPQAHEEFKSSLASYSQGRGSFRSAFTAERAVSETEILLFQARLQEQVEVAAIERLTGGDL